MFLVFGFEHPYFIGLVNIFPYEESIKKDIVDAIGFFT